MDDRVLRFAPMMRFSSQETHYPIDPSLFVTRSRLLRMGWSPLVGDGYWNSAARAWDLTGPASPPPSGALNPQLSHACAAMQAEAPSAPGARRNRRPNDPANLWGGSRSGYALELTQAFARDLRGVPGSAPFLMYDRYQREGPSGRWDVITYWFFYALNPHVIAHEGDWEPVTVVVDEAGHAALRVDCHGSTRLQSFETLEIADQTHPVIYVEPGSHRACSEPLDAGLNGVPASVTLRTWRNTPTPVQHMPWSCYDGAWGRVGATELTTGPLGPLFRRMADAAVPVALAG